jgi:acyl-CoA synthetase (AMP-forming)/AMP-acid ligase II
VAQQQLVPLLELVADAGVAGPFRMQWLSADHKLVQTRRFTEWGARDTVCLVLHTSGTTNKPKIVPLTHESTGVGSTCISSTLKLKKTSLCLNVMPLFHIHGLAVNVLATLASGAHIIA